MSFSSYHRFANRELLYGLVQEFKHNNTIPASVYENYQRYHNAVMHKLSASIMNVADLKDILINTQISQIAEAKYEFSFGVNRYIDGFFYNSGSVFDILARLVLTLYDEQITGDVYYKTAYEKLRHSHPSDTILLNRLKDPRWKSEFSNYRNTSTHELMLAELLHIELALHDTEESPVLKFPLPDNPKALPSQRTYRRNKSALEYIERSAKRIISLCNTIYGHIYREALVTNRLPL